MSTKRKNPGSTGQPKTGYLPPGMYSGTDGSQFIVSTPAQFLPRTEEDVKKQVNRVKLGGGVATIDHDAMVKYVGYTIVVAAAEKDLTGSGKSYTYDSLVHHGTGAMVLPIIRDGGEERFMLIKQKRPSFEGRGGGWIWELPGGNFEAGKHNTLLDVVIAEALEEGGLTAKKIVMMYGGGLQRPLAGYVRHPEGLFLAECESKVVGQTLDTKEGTIERRMMTKKEVLNLLDNGDPDGTPVAENTRMMFETYFRRTRHYRELLRDAPDARAMLRTDRK